MARQGACVMGFNIQKSLEKNRERGEHFTPCDLNEGNVQAIFNRCLATDSTTEYIKSVLYQKEHGYAENSNPILFDKKALLDNLKNIRYLYGQLITVHLDTNTINTHEDSDSPAMKNYRGEIWTMNKGSLLQFFHLGVGSNTISPFTLKGNSGFKYKIPVTLSPKDPAFPAWWEAHRGEWED